MSNKPKKQDTCMIKIKSTTTDTDLHVIGSSIGRLDNDLDPTLDQLPDVLRIQGAILSQTLIVSRRMAMTLGPSDKKRWATSWCGERTREQICCVVFLHILERSRILPWMEIAFCQFFGLSFSLCSRFQVSNTVLQNY